MFDLLANTDHLIPYSTFAPWYTQFKSSLSSSSDTMVSVKRVSKMTEKRGERGEEGVVGGGDDDDDYEAEEGKKKRAKKAAKDVVVAVPTSSSSSGSGSVPMAKKTALLKALVHGLKASIKSKKWYAHGGMDECAGESPMSPEEFKCMFGALGTAIVSVNKDGEKKKSSVVTNKSLSEVEVKALFGKLIEGLSTETFNKPQSFSKQFKTGKADLSVSGASLTYSSNTQTLKMKFVVRNQGSGLGGGFCYPSFGSSFGFDVGDY